MAEVIDCDNAVNCERTREDDTNMMERRAVRKWKERATFEGSILLV